MLKKKIGSLYVVATPIGNLQDITLRAIEVLKSVDRIAAEDTRHSGSLLKHFAINKPSISLHNYNEQEKLELLINYLEEGENIALISDAGTPLISDPGYLLVSNAKSKGIKVVPIPGACALIAALAVSGLATDKFVFEGFLPAKEEARAQRLKLCLQETRTSIFYEAPHRLMNTLVTMQTIFGDERQVVVARELTKIHESIINASIKEIITYYKQHSDECRGEIVLLIAGVEVTNTETIELQPEKILEILLEELPLKQAVAITAKLTHKRKNELYELALLKKSNPD